ncbi:MAG: iron ABC transporter permease [Sphingobacteriaceae bacterium]|nr:iron ABC transporter permease [Sphingobacteriaceae bacterium]
MKEGILVKYIIIVAALFLTIGLSLFFGGTAELNEYIFYAIRLPKSITAFAAGASLAVAGLILQIIFRNPLAGPYVLGISSGASLAVALITMGGTAFGLVQSQIGSKSIILLASVLGSLAIMLVILILAKKINRNVILLLIGIMIAHFCGAFQGGLSYFANPGELKSFVMWSLGSLSDTTLLDSILFFSLSSFFIFSVFLYAKPLQAFLMGQNYTVASGINYAKKRFGLIFISSALTGITTAFCGPIAFVGISVPLIARIVFKTANQSIQISASIIIGATLVLFSDVICHLFPDFTFPINMITTLLGAPFVIYLLLKSKNI